MTERNHMLAQQHKTTSLRKKLLLNQEDNEVCYVAAILLNKSFENEKFVRIGICIKTPSMTVFKCK